MPTPQFLALFQDLLGSAPVIAFPNIPGVYLDHQGEGFGGLVKTNKGLGLLGLWRHKERLGGLFVAHLDGPICLPFGLPRQRASAQPNARQALGEGLGLLGWHLGNQQGAHLLHQG